MEPMAEAEAAVDCRQAPNVTWENWGNGFFLTYCNGCHAEANTEARQGAPAGVHFDEEADVVALAERVKARVIDSQTMPGGGGVQPDDLALLERYLACRSAP